MKLLRDWTIGDVLALQGRKENDVLDIKSDLDGGGVPDPWHAGGKLSTTARDDIAKAVIAFANHDGGVLLLGVRESDREGDVDRVGEPRPIRACEDLAKVLQDSLRDIVDPPLAGVLVRGIRVDPAKDEGVVAIEVRSSPSAPHWNKSKGRAFIRRGHRSDPMTMREIQDLTILRERGAERLDEQFAAAAAQFIQECSNDGGSWALSVAAIPLSRMSLPDFKSDRSLVPEYHEFTLTLAEGGVRQVLVPLRAPQFRARVRGASRIYDTSDKTKRGSISAFRDGRIEARVFFRSKHPHQGTYVAVAGWFLAVFASVLDHVGRLRDSASAPGNIPCAIEVVIKAVGPIEFYTLRDDAFDDRSKLETGATKLPRYEFTDASLLTETALLFVSDLYDLVGRDETPQGTLALST